MRTNTQVSYIHTRTYIRTRVIPVLVVGWKLAENSNRSFPFLHNNRTVHWLLPVVYTHGQRVKTYFLLVLYPPSNRTTKRCSKCKFMSCRKYTHQPAIHSLAIHSLAIHSLAIHSLAIHSLAIHSLAIHSLAIHSLAIHSLAIHSLALYKNSLLLIAVTHTQQPTTTYQTF